MSDVNKSKVLIIGGGIVGCSIAYHLTKLGWKDVTLIEKGELTSGSTWHAAGLVGQLRSSRNVTRMLGYSVEAYERLEEETGQPTGWKKVGGLRLASSPERMQELKKAATTAKSFGMDFHLISAKEAQDLFPLMDTKGVVGAGYTPTDGYADPSQITQAFAKGARMGGANIIRHIRVESIQTKDRRATLVKTDKGDFEAEIVVNAAGMWADEIGRMAGVNVPLIPVQHQFMVTEVLPDIPKNLPTLRDPDLLVYYKEEAGGLVMGGYEHNPIPWAVNGIPREFGQELLDSNFDHFAPLFENSAIRVPVMNQLGVRKLINGPESFTPDGHFIMGLAPELDNFYVAAGFNAHGIAAGGGAGKMLAEWIVEGEPSLDLWPVDIRRFGTYTRDRKYVEARTLELYGKHYTISWPHEEHESGRGIKKSPLYPILKDAGAVFGSKSGWERPNWFAPKGVEAKDIYTFDRPNWFEHVAHEHKCIREKVALIDQTSFSKFEVEGPGALAFLNSLADNNIDKPIGRLTYTQLCNERGGIEADLTIARIAEDKFYMVTGTAFGNHDRSWVQKHQPKDGSVTFNDVSQKRAVLNLCGPKSRDVLKKVTSDDVSNEHFKFARCHEININGAKILALRITYLGELGWELHVPNENAVEVYRALWKAGEEFGIQNAGYRAIETCRLEKGYRYWSSDITPDYDPFSAGLGFCVNFKKESFIGREALATIKETGPKETLVCFTLEKHVQLFGGETICKDGKVLGVLTSGGFGHTIQKPIGYGYVPSELKHEQGFTIEVMGETINAIRHDDALYDANRERILS